MISLTLPYPPTVNHYKQVGRLALTKKGKLYQPRITSEKTKRFYYEVWFMVKQYQFVSFGDKSLKIEIDVYPPDARKRDIDNVIKPTCDSLQKAGLFNDDYQIGLITVKRCSIMKQGQILVRLSEL
jgi:crossover junction endodeoxyribonuclease RusA